MIHVEFALVFLALLWLMWMVASYRYSDIGLLEREIDDIKANQAYALEVLRVALTEIIGIDKTEAVIESAASHLPEYRKALAAKRGIKL